MPDEQYELLPSFESDLNNMIQPFRVYLTIQTSDMAPTSSKEFPNIQANYRVWIHSETRT